jgi:hypothetical protein
LDKKICDLLVVVEKLTKFETDSKHRGGTSDTEELQKLERRLLELLKILKLTNNVSFGFCPSVFGYFLITKKFSPIFEKLSNFLYFRSPKTTASD